MQHYNWTSLTLRNSMSDMMRNEPQLNQADNSLHEKNHHAPQPYWRRMHLHWGFWVGVIGLTIALLVYILSVNLALVPHPSVSQQQTTTQPAK